MLGQRQLCGGVGKLTLNPDTVKQYPRNGFLCERLIARLLIMESGKKAFPVDVVERAVNWEAMEAAEEYLGMVRREERELALGRDEGGTSGGESSEDETGGHEANDHEAGRHEATAALPTPSSVSSFVSRFTLLQELFVPGGNPPAPLPTTNAEWREFTTQNEPSNALIASLSLPTTLRLVHLATKWLSNSTSDRLSRWVFALLVRTPRTLTPSDVAVVRALGVKAQKLVPKSTSNHARWTHQGVVAVAAQCYGQSDLHVTFT